MSRSVPVALGLVLAWGAPAIAVPAPRALVAASYAEGPLVTRGELWYTEYGAHRVMAWDGRRARVVWQRAGQGPSALAQAPDGCIWVTCYDANRLVKLTRAGREAGQVTRDAAGLPLLGPNDMVSDGRGGLYVTASGSFAVGAPASGRVYHMPGGGPPRVVVAGLAYANGIATIAGGTQVLVAETLGRRIARFTVLPDGGLVPRGLFASLEGCVPVAERRDPLWGPDGLRVDARGRIHAAVFGAGRVQAFTAAGRPDGHLVLPVPYVTNVAFSPTGRRAYVTASRDANRAPYPGAIYTLTLRRPPGRAGN